jgi:hypothetical protein
MLHSAYASRLSRPACLLSQSIAVRTHPGRALSSEPENAITIQCVGVSTVGPASATCLCRWY